MAVKIEEPREDDIDIGDWHLLLGRTTFQGGGFMQVTLAGLNTSSEPKIISGSRLEVNGYFYTVKEDEKINIPNNMASEAWAFIYAKAAPDNLSNLSFEYRTTKPVWDTPKNGWYSGNDRAIAKTYRRSNSWWGKVILNDYESMYKDNFSVMPASGGTLVYQASNAINTTTDLEIEPGAYLIKMKGGRGGNGGASGAYYSGGGGLNNLGSGGKGGVPQTTSKVSTFYVEPTIDALEGENGVNGSINGNNRQAGGGGGGAAGILSFIEIIGKLILYAPGTAGTKGANAVYNVSIAAGDIIIGYAVAAAESTTPAELNETFYVKEKTKARLYRGLGGGNGTNGNNGINSSNTNLISNTGKKGSVGGATDDTRHGYVKIYRLWSSSTL